MSTTGERIRELRQRNRLTLDDVAKYLGVGRQAIYKYEQGTVTNIPLENLEKMATLFGTTPEYLAGWTENVPSSESTPAASDDIRLLIRGLNKLSPEQVAQAKNVFRAMFAITNPDLFEGDDDNDPGL